MDEERRPRKPKREVKQAFVLVARLICQVRRPVNFELRWFRNVAKGAFGGVEMYRN